MFYFTQFCSENIQNTEAERDDEEYQDTVVITINISSVGHHNCSSPQSLSSVIKPSSRPDKSGRDRDPPRPPASARGWRGPGRPGLARARSDCRPPGEAGRCPPGPRRCSPLPGLRRSGWSPHTPDGQVGSVRSLLLFHCFIVVTWIFTSLNSSTGGARQRLLSLSSCSLTLASELGEKLTMSARISGSVNSGGKWETSWWWTRPQKRTLSPQDKTSRQSPEM